MPPPIRYRLMPASEIERQPSRQRRELESRPWVIEIGVHLEGRQQDAYEWMFYSCSETEQEARARVDTILAIQEERGE